MMASVNSVCDDLSEFLDSLKKMRVLDDKITNKLNTVIPTESFSKKIDATATCRDLFTQLSESHLARNTSLQKCIDSTVVKVQKLQEQRNQNKDDLFILKNLRKEQTKLRELQTQMNVEEVIRGTSLKVYNERCRGFYKPPAEPAPTA